MICEEEIKVFSKMILYYRSILSPLLLQGVIKIDKDHCKGTMKSLQMIKWRSAEDGWMDF